MKSPYNEISAYNHNVNDPCFLAVEVVEDSVRPDQDCVSCYKH